MRCFFISLLVWFVACFPASAHDGAQNGAQNGAKATYLGNEGVLVARGDTKIVFDAFYADSYGQYTLVPARISRAMLAGEAPYDGVDAVFVSHVHGDHFTAAPAVEFLRAHGGVRLYGSQQVFDAIQNETGEGDEVLSRVVAVGLAPADPAKSFSLGGLEIEVVAIPHAGGAATAGIQNLSWRVTLDEETTVTHFGDPGVVRADFERHADHFAARRADAAFPPYWFFDGGEGAAIINDYMNADQVIGVHVPFRAAGDGERWRNQAGGDLFTDPGEKRGLD